MLTMPDECVCKLGKLGFEVASDPYGWTIGSSTSPKTFGIMKQNSRYALKVDWGAMFIDVELLNVLTDCVNSVNRNMDAQERP